MASPTFLETVFWPRQMWCQSCLCCTLGTWLCSCRGWSWVAWWRQLVLDEPRFLTTEESCSAASLSRNQKVYYHKGDTSACHYSVVSFYHYMGSGNKTQAIRLLKQVVLNLLSHLDGHQCMSFKTIFSWTLIKGWNMHNMWKCSKHDLHKSSYSVSPLILSVICVLKM